MNLKRPDSAVPLISRDYFGSFQLCNSITNLCCVFVFRARDLKKQHEQRVYEREMQRITLPLSAFSNPTCELVDENTIVITTEHETTPVQEGMGGQDPLMGQQAGTPGAWVRPIVLQTGLCSVFVDQNTPISLGTSVLKGVREECSLQRLEQNAVSSVPFSLVSMNLQQKIDMLTRSGHHT